MKLTLELSGPHGKMWDLDMKYHKLPPEYAMEIASVARSYVSYIAGIAGGASSEDPSYEVKFKFDAEEAGPKKVPAEFGDLYSGSANADNLLYSQAVEIQDAGIELLKKLQDGAHMEIKSGQRK